MAKKRKKKQKIKSRFLDVMERGAGGEVVVKQVGLEQAVTDFGEPIMDFLARLTNGPEGPNMDVINITLNIVHMIWYAAADDYDMSVLEKLQKSGRIGEMFNWEKLLPAMYKRHKQMFPSFFDATQQKKQTIAMHLDVEQLDMYEFLSTLITDNFPIEGEVPGERARYDVDAALKELKDNVETNPNDVGLRLEYGRALASEDKFGDALEQLEKGYELVPEFGDKQLEKMLISEILDCLNLLGRELSDFAWRTQPEIMSPTEFEQKMFVYVTQNGGRAVLVEAMTKVLGSKFIAPGEDSFAQVLKGERLALAHDSAGAPVVELV